MIQSEVNSKNKKMTQMLNYLMIEILGTDLDPVVIGNDKKIL